MKSLGQYKWCQGVKRVWQHMDPQEESWNNPVVRAQDYGVMAARQLAGIFGHILVLGVVALLSWILFYKALTSGLAWTYSLGPESSNTSPDIGLWFIKTGGQILFWGYVGIMALKCVAYCLKAVYLIVKSARRGGNQMINLGLARLPGFMSGLWKWHWRRLARQGTPDALGVLQALPDRIKRQLGRPELRVLLLSPEREAREEAIIILGQQSRGRIR